MEKTIIEKVKLPCDLVYEILSWCDLNALVTHKYVCKEWLGLISDAQFVSLNRQRTKIRGVFFQRLPFWKPNDYNISFLTPWSKKSVLSLDFLPETVRIEAVTSNRAGQGLVCCFSNTNYHQKYYVCKPTTQEWALIPNPRSQQAVCMGMGIMTNGNPPLFKIVRLSIFHYSNYFTEVFDSTMWEWKTLPGSHINFADLSPHIDPGLSIDTTFYWINWSAWASLFLSFDLETEEWSHVSLPDEISTRNANEYGKTFQLKLGNLGGNLAILGDDKNNISGNHQIIVWVMVNKVNESWEKKWSFDLRYGWEQPYLGFFSYDLALVKNSRSIFFHDLYW